MARRALHPATDAAIARLRDDPNVPMASPRIRLREYMVSHGLSIRTMSSLICMGRQQLQDTINGVCHNKTFLPLYQAFAIEWATKGQIEAWEWLDDPYVREKIRRSQMERVKEFEARVLDLVLKGRGHGTAEGMIRRKARTLSRLFQVNWAEAKRRAWANARSRADWESADVSHLMIAVDGE